ncbi:hypothetical protein ND856_19460 [Leptospira bandrabouensis]|uniref:hypothetical protein n=1 Tax=Leptospira bandrabouensis TaxID=2484903 RepID=UPI00223D4D3C|nr:hypothetical protein [Leptospira bandrabouensis]MCW7479487.1 hypothetical protein [Leptospira bandrabouensis]MCW7487170.1 hypothetical protein [Leptospira bandrabouensis]
MEIEYKILESMRNILINKNIPLHNFDSIEIEEEDIKNGIQDEDLEDIRLWLNILKIQNKIHYRNNKYLLNIDGVTKGIKIDSLSLYLENFAHLTEDTQLSMYEVTIDQSNLKGTYTPKFISKNLEDFNDKIITFKDRIISQLGSFVSYYLIEYPEQEIENRFASHFLPESHTIGSDLYLRLVDINYFNLCLRSEENFRRRT